MPRPRSGPSEALDAAGVAHQVQYAGNLFSVFFRAEPVHDFAGAQRRTPRRYKAFFHAMLAAGVYLRRARSRPGSSSARTTTRPLDRIAEALPDAARAAAEAE